MAFSKEMLEYLHDSGQMPDWAYYQQNGKSAAENYRDIIRREQRERELKRQEEEKLAEYRRRREKEIEEELEAEAEKKLSAVLDKTIDDLLKDFK